LTTAQLTTAGQLIGTAHYMSPEQATGRADVGPRSDLYSLGVVAFEMLSGQRPFQAETPLEALTQRLTQAPRLLRTAAAHVPPDLAQAVNRCLEKQPENRWPDARLLREALLPSDEDVDEPQLMRVLRTIVTIVLPLGGVAFLYVRLFAAMHPESRTVRLDFLAGALAGPLLVVVFIAVRLRTLGFDAPTIARSVFEQPRWSRSWYPRALRRRGDVWDRLPREYRQSRAYRGLFRIFVFVGFVPLWLLAAAERKQMLQLALGVVMLSGLGVLFALRRRAVRRIVASLQIAPLEAMTILNTPSSRLSAWRRPPASALLADRTIPSATRRADPLE
jgi:hypothetical protein